MQDFDANGELKAEVVPFIMLHLMITHPDFTLLEKSDMEHIVEELAMLVPFSPNYHCKIAGEGVEN